MNTYRLSENEFQLQLKAQHKEDSVLKVIVFRTVYQQVHEADGTDYFYP